MRPLNLASILILAAAVFAISACSPTKKSEDTELPSTDETTTTTTTTTTISTTTSTLTVNQKKIAVGWDKTFSILSTGNARSCGANVEQINGTGGQLGLGVSGAANYNTPQAITDGGTTYLSVVSSEVTACGLTNTQRVKCWGGYVGDGTGAEKTSPTFTNDTSSYIDISAGSYHSCGVTTDGILKCWGDGWDGKLGNGDATGATQDSPVIAASGTSFKRVAAGRNHTCGITTASEVMCWGTNGAGQIGIGNTTTPQLTAVAVDPGTTYTEIAAGEDASCGITTAGVLKCWGDNTDGLLGDGTTTNRSSPVVIDAGVTYSKISIGGIYWMHACGVTTSGVLKCWGNNSQGQIGNGTTTGPVLSPTTIDAGVSYREVATIGKSTCAITNGGALKCWGNNSVGQLCNGNSTQQTSPVTIGTGF